MQRVLAASGSTTHMAARPGLSGSSRARAATAAATARLTPAGRGNALRLAMPQHAGAAAAGPRTRAPVRVSAAADPAVKLTGDDLKEANRKQMRTVFDFELWRKHRSSARYWRHITGIFESRIVSGLAAPLGYVAALSTTVALYHVLAEAGYIMDVPDLKLASNAPFGLTSFALSLLLVFRTNSSYGRWDEARKMWGLIVNRSRDFVRQGLGYIPDSQPELQNMLCRWTVAYSRSLMCHLRPGENLEEELKETLPAHELKALLSSTHRPNYVVQVLTAVLKEAQLPTAVTSSRDSTAVVPAGAAYRMDENLTVFADVTGGCERILRTPIPLSYTRHTSRFMMIWLTLLPFTLWDSCRWAMVPISLIVSFLLLGIEEIGVSIEEPFTILPLEVISRTIEGNVKELQKMHSSEGKAVMGASAEGDNLSAQALVDAVLPAISGNGNGGALSAAGSSSGSSRIVIKPAMAMQQRASAAPKRSAATGARALVAHPAACRCAAHRRGRSLVVRAASDNVMEVGGRTIVVEDDGTIIISQPAASAAVDVKESAEVEYLTARSAIVNKHFEGSLGADDFIQRVEMALYAFGFTGENSIAMVNLCRDEVTVTLKQKIDAVFGASFSTNGLGGVLTCGAVGMGAGFSHSPICDTTGKERYIFFSFPHISINSKGEVGPMSRPGRPGQSCACGALIKSWTELRSEGVSCNCKIPGVHDAENPEYSILKQRIARRLRHEGETDESVQQLSLVDITKVAERTISDDLEYLISKTVDTNKADYAVITGVQVHNWAFDFEDDSPNLEFVFPTSAYVVVDGVKTHVDLAAMPPLTPRQIRLVHGGDQGVVCNTGGQSTLRAEDPPYAYDSKDARKVQRTRLQNYISLIKDEGLESVAAAPSSPAWAKQITKSVADRTNSTALDMKFAQNEDLKEMQAQLEAKYQSL
ncbi:low-CO2 inducible [Micractinium conductrix]|uniref:Low-CO2 inducible n=1 Tax=Micractinium conductrix TaxID=554055 RepID=A0A2P6V7D5_9CHLO|nr:low-CO2 inducible [Micractinium conductrix]|eukprot:PSC69999.1 low-CO2 inducible [Micractinium conductrix]